MARKDLKKHPLIDKAVGLFLAHGIEDPVLLNIQKIHKSLYDFILIGTCQSEIQMKALLNKIRRSLLVKNGPTIRMEFSAGAKWALMDCGELIIHLFEKNTRHFYSLERLWNGAVQYEIDPEEYTAVEEASEDFDEFL